MLHNYKKHFKSIGKACFARTTCKDNFPDVKCFVYHWFNHETGKRYIGSHYGSLDDGYICSNKLVQASFKKNPFAWTREIFWHSSQDARDTEGNTAGLNMAQLMERKYLVDVNADIHPDFYNRSLDTGSFR